MLKNVLSILLGYSALSLLVFLTFSTAFFILGPENSLQPNSYQISFLWLYVSAVLTLVSSFAGGYVCIQFSDNHKSVFALAVIILSIGLAVSFFKISNPDMIIDKPRPMDAGNIEAMLFARQPVYFMFLHPFISAAGTLINVVIADKLRFFWINK